jgi:hypothetical protein
MIPGLEGGFSMRSSCKALVLILALAACGEGSSFDKGFKKSYREKGIAACTEQARSHAPSPAAAAQVDFEGLCTCAIDKTMEGKSATDLMGPPDANSEREAISYCIGRMAKPAGGAGKAAPPGA